MVKKTRKQLKREIRQYKKFRNSETEKINDLRRDSPKSYALPVAIQNRDAYNKEIKNLTAQWERLKARGE